MAPNIYRIHESILFSVNNTPKTYTKTYVLEENNIKQYLNNTDLFETVWYSKFTTYGRKLNKYTWGTQIGTLDRLNNLSLTTVQASLMLKQGFSFENVFGILFVLKEINSDIVYKSRIFKASDFKFNANNQQINGSFWASSINFSIPDISLKEQSLSFGVEVITFDDIHSDDTVLTYPNVFEPLISDMVLSDKISVKLNWNDKLQLEIEPVSALKEYTLEQILRWNFSVSEINNLSIEYLVRFLSDTDGNYSEYIISNNINPLNKINIGLPLIYTDDIQTIEVVAYFKINDLIATRYVSIVWNHFDTVNSLIEQYIATKNDNIELNPITVIENVNIENNIIDTIKDTKLAQIITPIYVEIVNDKDIVVDNKMVSFKNIVNKAYIKVIFDADDLASDKNKIIISEITSDDVIFFDINLVNTLMKESSLVKLPYRLYDFLTGKLILTGNFLS